MKGKVSCLESWFIKNWHVELGAPYCNELKSSGQNCDKFHFSLRCLPWQYPVPWLPRPFPSDQPLLSLKNTVDKKGTHFTQIFRSQSIHSSHGICRSMSPPLLKTSNTHLCLVNLLSHWNIGRLREKGEEKEWKLCILIPKSCSACVVSASRHRH